MGGVSIIDIVLALIIAYGFYLGFARGIIQTVFSVLSIFFGVMAAIRFAPAVTRFLSDILDQDSGLMYFVGIGVSFLIMMIFIRTLAKGLESLLQAANINFINQMAGGILLAGFFTFLYSWVVMFCDNAHLISTKVKEESRSFALLQEVPDRAKNLYDVSSPTFKSFWDHTLDAFDKLDGIVETTEGNAEFRDLPDEDLDAIPRDSLGR